MAGPAARPASAADRWSVNKPADPPSHSPGPVPAPGKPKMEAQRGRAGPPPLSQPAKPPRGARAGRPGGRRPGRRQGAGGRAGAGEWVGWGGVVGRPANGGGGLEGGAPCGKAGVSRSSGR